MSRLTLSIAALFILVLLTSLPYWFGQQNEVLTQTEDVLIRPAYQAKNITTSLYNSDGALTHEVFAAKMEHYDIFGFVSFENPLYTLFPENGADAWEITAHDGTLFDNQQIQLEGNVVVKATNLDAFVQTVTTQYIELDVAAGKMQSNELVEISGHDYTISGNGFSADIRTGQYELLDHVQTIFTPTP